MPSSLFWENVLLSCWNEPIEAFGLARLTVLKKLTDSMRNSSSLVSLSRNFLKSDASVRQ